MMMILDWTSGSPAHPEDPAIKAMKSAGFEHGQKIEGDPFEVAKKLFEAGLNVMVYHCDHDKGRSSRFLDREVDAIVFVDTKRFSQR